MSFYSLQITAYFKIFVSTAASITSSDSYYATFTLHIFKTYLSFPFHIYNLLWHLQTLCCISEGYLERLSLWTQMIEMHKKRFILTQLIMETNSETHGMPSPSEEPEKMIV